MSDHGDAPRKIPTTYDELFPGRFLKAGLLKGREVTLTISRVDTEALPQDDGKERVRGIVSFARTDLQLVLNSTNGQAIIAIAKALGGSGEGKHLPDWIGKRITLAPERDKFGREMVDCIRVAGSPDLPADMTVEIRLPRKKPKQRTLRKTGGPRKSGPKVAPPPVAEPQTEPEDPGPWGP